MIRKAIFDLDADKKVKENFMFTNNNLVVTNVDIQRVEPVDSSTKESLQKSVTLAIETTTQMQESAAKKEANQKEQEAKGSL
jgi:major vault protein